MAKLKGKFVHHTEVGNLKCPLMDKGCYGDSCMLWIDCKELKGDKVGCGSCGLLGTEQAVPNTAKKA
ncbi:MAG: hypothetical protein CMB80_01790 [Flammeovirgaceae bacterium]|nr:hypothetical protein [Flammeovirgaceae bacterium]|tara:strand:- start:656 stop:856 length:201 start_codon:yes stop_codon:yes gene_type:complete